MLTVTGFAQEIEFEHLGTTQGLPATEAYNLFQDKTGYIWVFTEYGIAKHNGLSFVPSCQNLPFSERAVYAVTEDEKGNLIIANSNAKIYRIINDKAYLLPGLEKLSAEILNKAGAIYQVFFKNGKLYISTYLQSWVYEFNNAVFYDISYQLTNELKFGYLVENNDQAIVLHLNPSFIKSKIANGLKDQLINYGLKDTRWFVSKINNTYICTGKPNSICKYNQNKLTSCKEFKPTVLFTRKSPDNSIWVGTLNNGIYVLDTNLAVQKRLLPNESVSNILFDNQNGIWITTLSNGVFHCKSKNTLSFENSFTSNDQITAIKNCNNKIFVGTENGNLFYFANQKLIPIKLNTTYYIKDIIFLNNHYYVSSKRHFFKLDSQFISKETFSVPVYGWSVVDSNSLLLAATSFVAEYNLTTKKETKHSPIYKPTCTFYRNNNQKLIGTRNGVFEFKDKMTSPPYLLKLKGVRITSITGGPDNSLFICTQGKGIYLLNKYNKLYPIKNLPTLIVKQVKLLTPNSLLLACNNGLYLSEYPLKNNNTLWKLILDGDISGFDIHQNYLFASTKKKLIKIPVDELFATQNTPFILSSVYVNDRLVNKSSLKSLTYDSKKIQFNFSLLNYKFPENALIYLLKGKSASSGKVTGTSLLLQNLEPGQYTLKVYRPFRDKSSISNTLKINFVINPAWWQMLWFKLLILLIGTSSISYLTFIIINRKQTQERLKAETENLLLEYKLTALKAQINPHFISNALAAIQHQILLGNTDTANLYLAKFSLLIRHVLSYSDKPAASLKDELTIIDLNVELEQLRFGNNFSYHKEISEEIDLNDIYIPPLITQPFVENAIWHGLLPLKEPQPGYLKIKVELLEEKFLILSIIDNGVGISKKGDQEISNLKNRESKGTNLIKNRIKNLNKLHNTNQIQIEIKDRKEINPVECGTLVKMIFPLFVLENLKDEKDKMPDY